MTQWQRDHLYDGIRRLLAQRPDGRLRRHWATLASWSSVRAENSTSAPASARATAMAAPIPRPRAGHHGHLAGNAKSVHDHGTRLWPSAAVSMKEN
jgi:hypothetical protein